MFGVTADPLLHNYFDAHKRLRNLLHRQAKPTQEEFDEALSEKAQAKATLLVRLQTCYGKL